MIKFQALHKYADDLLGFIPCFLDEQNPLSAREQLDANYQHGGGWNPFKGFSLNKPQMTLVYPGDPPMRPIAKAQLRDETIYVYEHAWVMILQKDGSWEVARMD